MKKTNTKYPLSLLIWTVVVLLGTQTILPNLILCLEEDGRVTVEYGEVDYNGSSLNTVTTPYYIAFPNSKTISPFETNDCYSCVDVQVPETNPTRRILLRSHSPVTITPCILFLPPLFNADQRIFHSPNPFTPQNNTQIASLQTVILLV